MGSGQGQRSDRRRRALSLVVAVATTAAGLVVLAPAAYAGTTRFAAPANQGTHDCLSAANACTLAAAITASGNGDTVQLTAGTYAVTSTPTLPVGTLTLDAAGAAVTLDGQGTTQLFSVGFLSTLNLIGITLTNGAVTGAAGTNGSAGTGGAAGGAGGAGGSAQGGAIYNNGTLTVVDCTFTLNTVTGGAGGAAQGGAIYNTALGTLNVAHSTFFSNSANGGAGGDGGNAATTSTAGTSGAGAGAAIYNNGGHVNVGSSTISHNDASHGNAGANYIGGVRIPGSGATGTTGAGGLHNAAAGTVHVHATILANQKVADGFGGSCSGTISDDGYNLDDDGTCGLNAGTSHDGTAADGGSTYGDVLDAYLATALASNGGGTQTLALLRTPTPATALTNPAHGVVATNVNVLVTEPGHAGTTVCAVPDQRGTVPSAGACDIGAYYLVPLTAQTISFTSTAPSSATVGGSTYTPTATATSGLAVTITVDGASTAVCSIAAGVVSFASAGTCTLDANQAGNGTYAAAPQVQQSFTVAAASTGGGGGGVPTLPVPTKPTAPKVDGTPSNGSPKPGDTITVTAPADRNGGAVFDPSSKPVVTMVETNNAMTQRSTPQPTLRMGSGGAVSVTVTIPPSTPVGVYVLTIVAKDAGGNVRVIVVPVTVTGVTTSAVAGRDLRASTATAGRRLSGTTRYGTAQAIAQVTPNATTVAVLAGDDNPADGASGAYLAGLEKAPLLNTPRDQVPDGLVATLKTIGVTGVQIMGGTAAVSEDVATQLRAAGFVVERLSGVDRYATARTVARLLPPEAVGSVGSGSAAIVVSGASTSDAVVAVPISAQVGVPIFFTENGSLSSSTMTSLASLLIKNVLIVGGTGAVGPAVEGQLQAAGMTSQRIAAASRQATAAAAAAFELGTLKFTGRTIELVAPDRVYDGLAAGVRAGATGSPVLFTAGAALGADASSFLGARHPVVELIGGPDAIDDAVADDAVRTAGT